MIEDLQKRIKQLENDLANAKTTQQKEKVQQEVSVIDKDALYVQKIEEGWKAWNNKNFEQALKIYDEAINLNPNDYQGYHGRGTAYAKLKNYSQAIKDFNQAIKLNQNDVYSYYNRGLCYQELGKNSEAEKDFAKARELGYNG